MTNTYLWGRKPASALTRMRHMGVPAAQLDFDQAWTYTSVDGENAQVHGDPACSGVATDGPWPNAPSAHMNWELCPFADCHDDALRDLRRIASSGYPYIDALETVPQDLADGTHASMARAEQQVGGAMLALGMVPWTHFGPFQDLEHPANVEWAQRESAALAVTVRRYREQFRSQWESQNRYLSDGGPARMMFVRDVTTELISNPHGASLRAGLVAYDWVAGGGQHRWAIVAAPAGLTSARYFVRAAGAGFCADLGDVSLLTAETALAFCTIYEPRMRPQDAMDAALSVSAPVLAAAS